MTPSTGSHGSLHQSADPPDAKARDRRVVETLEAALAGNASTLTTYVTRWRSFAAWCDATDLMPLPATPDTVVRYLEAHADSGSSYATLRLTVSVVTRVHQLDGYWSPCADESVKEALKRSRFKLAKPRSEIGVLTPDSCYWISVGASQRRDRGRGRETQADRRGRVDVALAYVMSEASELSWGDVRLWADGSGRVTVPGSLTGGWTRAAIVAVTSETMDALDAMRPSDAAGNGRVFGISAAQIGRGLRAAAKAGWIDNWEAYNGRAGLRFRLAENRAPAHVVARQAHRMQPNGIVGRYASDACAAQAVPYL